ncbi:M12 family metallopeptidase [Bacillus thuringiensis]|nr:M12 family metallopeptidase [Bacillus thuringiensis]OUB65004.1 hypothetical protein BK744_30030 [Bacillus thuringiensis serovar zhaodongensis]HDR5271239.1 M12 family metallopeptidase [Bacillus thuringiensis]
MGNNEGLELIKGTELYSPDLAQINERTAYIKFVDKDPQKVEYVVINNLAIAEGDMIIGNADEMREGNGLTSSGFTYIRELGRKWPNGIVPYIIDPALPQPERVHQAVEHWNSKTIIKLQPRINQQNYIKFTPGDGCSSWIGMQGGEQTITIGASCSVGNTIHEIGHAIGMYHEQSAPDRDEHVEILWDNIEESAKFNFRKTDWVEAGVFGVYDYQSIMHYGRFAFSKNNQPTIIPKLNVEIGQRAGLSNGDVVGVNSLYS